MLQTSLWATTFTLTSLGKETSGRETVSLLRLLLLGASLQRELATPKACIALESRLLHSAHLSTDSRGPLRLDKSQLRQNLSSSL